MVQNIHRETLNIIAGLQQQACRPKLLLHSCCAPCSSHTLLFLAPYFEITVLYYNPNIAPAAEYERRLEEQRRLLAQLPLPEQVPLLEVGYDPQEFYAMAKGRETEKEGGNRCFDCYALRLRKTAEIAKAGGYDFFTTTLSISPHKNARVLYDLGENIARQYGVAHLPADFKKQDGYHHSIQLSEQYGLYRQDYCGCVFSQQEAAQRRAEKACQQKK